MSEDSNEASVQSVVRWRFSWICQRPTIGSRWYQGNFNLGLMIDSHPQFFNCIIGLLFIEVGVSFEKR